MKQSQPQYYSIIPAYVRYDNELKPMEKLIYSEITALSNANGYCHAGNNYFAELYEVHKKTVSTWISKLEKRGYIKVAVFRNENKVVIERRIYINDNFATRPLDPIHKKMDTLSTEKFIPYPQKNGDPIHENTEYNNTSINNTSINREIRARESTKLNNTNNSNKEHETQKYKNIISMYQKNFGIVNAINYEHINNWLTDFEEKGSEEAIEIMLYAMNIAAENNAGSFKYVEKILNNWLQRNLISLEDVKRISEQSSKKNPKKEIITAEEDKSKWENIDLDKIL